MNNSKSFSEYEKYSQYLEKNNIVKNSVIVSNPDMFYQLYYHDRFNIYFPNIDWQVDLLHNEERYNDYINMIRGETLYPSMFMDKYNFKYLLLDNYSCYSNFKKYCEMDYELVLVYYDDEVSFYEYTK